ncbi:Signal transduction histidine kinase [Nonomuraea solani]|uniref:histidine kinase n=1 Tax=Nonomuraea solani TaxID=1144553 RepID=A0A1H6EXN3_9ACTN|nr:sensor histidine kinase [Nonomuraea solani]SEH02627.1 Signal transduction histidine kinase [Nonomuraea solani]
MLQNGRPEDADGVPDWVFLALVAAGQTFAISLIIAVGAPSNGYSGWGAYAFAAGFGAVLLAYRAAPLAVLVVTIVGIFTYYALDFPPIGMAVPAAAALYFAAERTDIWWPLGGGLGLLVVSAYFRAVNENEPGDVLSYDLLTNAALIGCAIALASTVRSRHQLREQQDRIITLERERERDRAEHAMQEERIRIARDLHDTIGHALAIVTVHANVAREAVGRDDGTVTRSLSNVTDATTRSLGELRATVSMLHSPARTDRAPHTLQGIQTIIETARQAGLTVRAELAAEPERVPPTIATAAHRIAQEAVTNVIKHAGATTLTITTGIEDDTLLLTIGDDGATPAAPGPGGHGVAGMRERAALLGGTLTTTRSSGTTVTARLPLTRESGA